MKIFLACMMLYGAIHIESAKAGLDVRQPADLHHQLQRLGQHLYLHSTVLVI